MAKASVLDLIRNAVERDLERWASDDDTATEGADVEVQTTAQRCKTPDVPTDGVRYQRCGGGRRRLAHNGAAY